MMTTDARHRHVLGQGRNANMGRLMSTIKGVRKTSNIHSKIEGHGEARPQYRRHIHDEREEMRKNDGPI